jgi:hypothetical protein
VFIGRVTPGLRIHTTEVSGLVGMPRSKFLTGLAPAVAVYETVFLGLGAWLGPTARATIHHYAPGPSDLVLMLVTIIGWVFAGRALVKALRDSTRGVRKRISGATKRGDSCETSVTGAIMAAQLIRLDRGLNWLMPIPQASLAITLVVSGGA